MSIPHAENTALAARTTPEETLPPMPPPPTIKVKVKRNAATREVKITSSHDVGAFMDIALCMSSVRVRKLVLDYVHNGYDLQYTIGRLTAVTPEAWAIAIAAEIRHRICPPAIDGPQEGEVALTTDDSVYMALGNTVYRMVPTEYVPVTRALTTMRRQIRERCKNEGQAIIRVAQDQATSVMAAAGEKMAEANALMSTARQQVVPPAWAVNAGLSLKRGRDRDSGISCWHIGFNALISLIQFEYEWTFSEGERIMVKKRTWASHNTQAKWMALWVPIQDDGSYNQRAIHVARGCEELPHIGANSGCMGLGGAPARLRSNTEVQSLAAEITRVMAVVNLNSLLTYGGQWPLHFQNAIPPSIKEGVMINSSTLYQLPNAQPTTEAVTPMPTLEEVEGTTNTTWRLPRI